MPFTLQTHGYGCTTSTYRRISHATGHLPRWEDLSLPVAAAKKGQGGEDPIDTARSVSKRSVAVHSHMLLLLLLLSHRGSRCCSCDSVQSSFVTRAAGCVHGWFSVAFERCVEVRGCCCVFPCCFRARMCVRESSCESFPCAV